jgi:hypothetical protein
MLVIFSAMKAMQLFVLSAALVLVTGCASSMASRAQKLELGMPKDRVVKLLGSKFTTVGAREESDARRTEVLRFEDPKSGEMFVYLRDGRLVQWGDVRALQSMPQ